MPSRAAPLVLASMLLIACGGKVAGDDGAEVPEPTPAPTPAPPSLGVTSAPVCVDVPEGTYTAEIVRKKGGDACGPVREERTMRVDHAVQSPEWTCTSATEPASCTFERTCSLALTEATIVRQLRYVTAVAPPYVRRSELRKLDLSGKVVVECVFEETLTPVW